MPVDEEVESQHLKFIATPPEGMTFNTAVIRFNSNVSYSGLLHAVTQDVSGSIFMSSTLAGEVKIDLALFKFVLSVMTMIESWNKIVKYLCCR